MRKNIRQAVAAFLNNQDFQTKNKSLRVRKCIGDSKAILYSYHMPIAWFAGNQVIMTGEKSPSKTTSQHMNGVKSLLMG